MTRYSGAAWRALRPGSLPSSQPRPEVPERRTGCEPSHPCRVLGLDPGSRRTGYGIIDCAASGERHVHSGCIEASGEDMVVRLQRIFGGVRALIEQHRPDAVAIERVFVHRNPDSALKLGQARGVALCAATQLGASVFEYAPRAIKIAVTGYGAAAKTQVAHMIGTLLKLEREPGADAADALAAALCHAHARRLGSLLARA